jgi:hypothetical protein
VRRCGASLTAAVPQEQGERRLDIDALDIDAPRRLGKPKAAIAREAKPCLAGTNPLGKRTSGASLIPIIGGHRVPTRRNLISD